MAQSVSALAIARYFTEAGTHSYDQLTWVKRDSSIVNPGTGKTVFEQKDVEFPEFWSQNAINIVAQKYFYGTPGTPSREKSLRQLIDRVANTITKSGYENGYFSSEEEADIFNAELKYILATQRAAFNSPVWFNIGTPDRRQQASACFILKVEDSLTSILNWYREEGMIFKGGSGAGLNISTLRGSAETLSTSGGRASGPVSFMRGADASAGTIASGGKTRRAAKMVILNIDHPDIEEFIWCKAIEERKAFALSAAGFDMSLNGKDIHSIQYQNANNSVRVTDDFMRAVDLDDDWNLVGVKDKKVHKSLKARQLFREIAEAAWESADPGMQFDTTVNDWHTTPNAGRINGSNPCSEYMHLDDSACNLASLNLRKFTLPGWFDIRSFTEAVDLTILAQEIIVGFSSYPTPRIWDNSHRFRPLGLGYANLGAMLMSWGIPYDSHEGRSFASSITALMTGAAYRMSAEIARACGGPCVGFAENREPFLAVIQKHRQACDELDGRNDYRFEIKRAALHQWDIARTIGLAHGFRNSQATVLAPTGTIGFMMDCDTTGVEPDIALVKYKRLVGGGMLKITNQTVTEALRMLGYSDAQQKKIVEHIEINDTIEGSLVLTRHLPVFDCAFRAEKGTRSIQPIGHIRMMAAVQPFLSGAISKTVNMPESATVEDIEQLHIDSWKMGLKAVAIYRDNCKVAQPLSMAKKDGDDKKDEAAGGSEDGKIVIKGAIRRKLPRIRSSRTYRFVVADLEGFFTVGEYPDGAPGELFISVSRQGSTLAGLMDSFAISVSHGLQYGVPLKSYVKTLRGTSFAPFGITDDPEIRTASSVTDYIVRRLALDYLSFDDRLELGLASLDDMPEEQTSLLGVDEADSQVEVPVTPTSSKQVTVSGEAAESQPMAPVPVDTPTQKKQAIKDATAPLCYNCGNQTQRSGSCYVCTSCGSTTGCS